MDFKKVQGLLLDYGQSANIFLTNFVQGFMAVHAFSLYRLIELISVSNIVLCFTTYTSTTVWEQHVCNEQFINKTLKLDNFGLKNIFRRYLCVQITRSNIQTSKVSRIIAFRGLLGPTDRKPGAPTSSLLLWCKTARWCVKDPACRFIKASKAMPSSENLLVHPR